MTDNFFPLDLPLILPSDQTHWKNEKAPPKVRLVSGIDCYKFIKLSAPV